MQATENKPGRLRLLLSPKSAAKIDPDVRAAMVEALMENPDPESLTRKFGSTAIQVVFSVLWVLALDVRRLKVRCAQTRDGFGRPRLEALEVERRPAGREQAEAAKLRVLGDVA